MSNSKKRQREDDEGAATAPTKRAKRVKNLSIQVVPGIGSSFKKKLTPFLPSDCPRTITLGMIENLFGTEENMVTSMDGVYGIKGKAQRIFRMISDAQQQGDVATGPPANEGVTAQEVADQSEPGASKPELKTNAEHETGLPSSTVEDVVIESVQEPLAPTREPAARPDFAADAAVTEIEQRAAEVGGASSLNVVQAQHIPTLPAAARTTNDAANIRAAMPPQVVDDENQHEILQSHKDKLPVCEAEKVGSGSRGMPSTLTPEEEEQQTEQTTWSKRLREMAQQELTGSGFSELLGTALGGGANTQLGIKGLKFAASLFDNAYDLTGLQGDERAAAQKQQQIVTDTQARIGQRHSDLFPYIAIGQASDVMLSENDPTFSALQQSTTFNNWKPQNWPNGGTDNALWVGGQIHHYGIRMMNPLKIRPDVAPGGWGKGHQSVHAGGQPAPFDHHETFEDPTMLRFVAKRWGLKDHVGLYKLLDRHVRALAMGEMDYYVREDPRFVYNEMAEGVSVPEDEAEREDMNFLDSNAFQSISHQPDTTMDAFAARMPEETVTPFNTGSMQMGQLDDKLRMASHRMTTLPYQGSSLTQLSRPGYW